MVSFPCAVKKNNVVMFSLEINFDVLVYDGSIGLTYIVYVGCEICVQKSKEEEQSCHRSVYDLHSIISYVIINKAVEHQRYRRGSKIET